MFQVGRIQSPTSLSLLKGLNTKDPLVPLQGRSWWLDEELGQSNLKEQELPAHRGGGQSFPRTSVSAFETFCYLSLFRSCF